MATKINLIDIFDSEVNGTLMNVPIFDYPFDYLLKLLIWSNVKACNLYFTNSASKEYCNEN